MPIVRSSIATRELDESPGAAIQLLTARPILSERFEFQHPSPGQLYGYYDSEIDMVELYIVALSGFYYKQVV